MLTLKVNVMPLDTKSHPVSILYTVYLHVNAPTMNSTNPNRSDDRTTTQLVATPPSDRLLWSK